MELTNYLALIGVIVGALYMALAVGAFNRSRRRHAEVSNGTSDTVGSIILNFSDDQLLDGEPTDDRMRKLATICASSGQRVFGEDFDYSMESIGRVDRAIMKGWGGSDGDVGQDVVLTFGAYLGEVLVRRTRGRWVSGMTETDPASVLFLAPNEDPVSFSPFLLVREKFNNMYKFDLAIAFTALEQKLKELQAA